MRVGGGAGDDTTERLVRPASLAALLPGVLLRNFTFWQRGATIVGESTSPGPSSMFNYRLHVLLRQDKDGVSAVVFRLPLDTEATPLVEGAEEGKWTGTGAAWLRSHAAVLLNIGGGRHAHLSPLNGVAAGLREFQPLTNVSPAVPSRRYDLPAMRVVDLMLAWFGDDALLLRAGPGLGRRHFAAGRRCRVRVGARTAHGEVPRSIQRHVSA